MVPRQGWHQLHIVDGGSTLAQSAHKVPEAFTNELADIVQVYRKVRYSTLSVPCCCSALHNILSWKSKIHLVET
ncbi:hypothetical protein DPMN_031471 [Dreissena polymorpha]|uniref:Uncharacterized protein n=1 Tax=Dreissena polymorpha TaxID=45954 RepID=A0A9D4M141_DREPO|nr:hypothetical protein DPMN_031471 [Dreissena polymorpha]